MIDSQETWSATDWYVTSLVITSGNWLSQGLLAPMQRRKCIVNYHHLLALRLRCVEALSWLSGREIPSRKVWNEHLWLFHPPSFPQFSLSRKQWFFFSFIFLIPMEHSLQRSQSDAKTRFFNVKFIPFFRLRSSQIEEENLPKKNSNNNIVTSKITFQITRDCVSDTHSTTKAVKKPINPYIPSSQLTAHIQLKNRHQMVREGSQ